MDLAPQRACSTGLWAAPRGALARGSVCGWFGWLSLPVSGFYSQYIFAKLVSQTTTDCNACLLMRPDFLQPQDGAVAMAPPRSLGCLVLGLELEGSLRPDSPFRPRRGRLGRGSRSRAGQTGSAGGTEAGPPGVGT